MSHRNQICDCGQPATRRLGTANICEFCYWCETQLVKGGEYRRRREVMAKPVVKRNAAWDEMVAAIRELHGNHAFWGQRETAREKFAALFRR